MVGNLADGWIHSIIPGDIRLYNDPVVYQVEIVIGYLLVPGMGQLDEFAPFAARTLLTFGLTDTAQKVLLPVELDARAMELRKVQTTCGNNVESFGVELLGVVACHWCGCWVWRWCGCWYGHRLHASIGRQ